MDIRYPQVGICGLSCKLCPMYHSDGKSKCEGCKSEERMLIGCSFITCAVKKKQIEFCWECNEKANCEKWNRHRDTGKVRDSFKSYQKLEHDIDYIQTNGIQRFIELQNIREKILKEMLDGFNEGRSKSYYCIAATVMEVDELEDAIARAKKDSYGLDIKKKARILHEILDEIADKKKYNLSLRRG